MCDDVPTVDSSNDVYLASPFYFPDSNTITPSNPSCLCQLTTRGSLRVQVFYADFTEKDFHFVCEACWGNNSQTAQLPLTNKVLPVNSKTQSQMYVVNTSLNHTESDTAGLKVWIKFTSEFVSALLSDFFLGVCIKNDLW